MKTSYTILGGGDILTCPVSFDEGAPPPDCDSSTPPGTGPGDSFGLSLNVAPDDTITVSDVRITSQVK